MRRGLDESQGFVVAVEILMRLEEELGITIEDETVEAIRPWAELTLNDLAMAAGRSTSSHDVTEIDRVIRAVIRSNYPEASEPLKLNVPLLNATSRCRRYRAPVVADVGLSSNPKVPSVSKSRGHFLILGGILLGTYLAGYVFFRVNHQIVHRSSVAGGTYSSHSVEGGDGIMAVRPSMA